MNGFKKGFFHHKGKTVRVLKHNVHGWLTVAVDKNGNPIEDAVTLTKEAWKEMMGPVHIRSESTVQPTVAMTEKKDETTGATGTITWKAPESMSDLDIAFGARAKDIPSEAEIPSEFFKHSNPFSELARALFFKGSKEVPSWQTREGIDRTQALGHVKAVLGSFEPSHERKMAAVGWMLYSWFIPESLGITSKQLAIK